MGNTGSRRRVVLFVAVAVVVVLAGAIWWYVATPHTPEERVLAAHEDLIEAYVDGDFGEVWDLLAGNTRAYGGQVATGLSPEDCEKLGLSRDRLERLDPRDAFILVSEHSAERFPEAWAKGIDQIRSLVPGTVRFEREGEAIVICDGAAFEMPKAEVGYLLEDGRWRFVSGSAIAPMGFKTLEKKLAAPLPKRRPNPEAIDAIVEIGPGDMDDVAFSFLCEALRAVRRDPVGETTILLDASPGAAWGAVVRAADDARVEGIERVYHLISTDSGPGPGLRVNGIPVDQAWRGFPALDATGRAAVTRVIGIAADGD